MGPHDFQNMGQRKTGPCLGGEDGEPSALVRGEAGKKPVPLTWLQYPSIFNTASAAPGAARGGSTLVASPGTGPAHKCGIGNARSSPGLDIGARSQPWGCGWVVGRSGDRYRSKLHLKCRSSCPARWA